MAFTLVATARIGVVDNWVSSQALHKYGSNWYTVVLDTSDAGIEVHKSADGTTFTEQDAADSVTNNATTAPFDWYPSGDFLYVYYFNGASTTRVRRFNMSTDQWEATDIGSANVDTAVVQTRNIRVAVRSDGDVLCFHSTSSLRFSRFEGSSWTTATVLASAPSTWCGAVMDGSDRCFCAYSDKTNNDFTYYVVHSDNSVDTADFDATVHTTNGIIGSQGVLYNDGTSDWFSICDIDADGGLDIWRGNPDATSGLINNTVTGAVSTSTTLQNTSVGLCVVDTSVKVAWSESNAIIRDASDDLTTPAFGSDTTVASGLTDTDPCPTCGTDGTAWIIVWQDNGNVRGEWIVAPPAGERVPHGQVIATPFPYRAVG